MTTETHQEFFKALGEYEILIYTPTCRGKVTIEGLYQQFADRLRHELQRDEMEAVIKKTPQRRKAK